MSDSYPANNTPAIVLLVAVWSALAIALRARARLPVRALRITLTLTAAVSAGVFAWVFWDQPRPQPSDLAQVWAGARALLRHENPYDVVGPGRSFEWPFPLFYLLTAVLTLIPLSPLPLRWVDPLFGAVGFALFAWAVTSRRLAAPALLALVSLPALMTVQTSQWSVLLTAAALLPAIGFVLIAKPTIGLALFIAFPHWKTAVGCALVLVLSVIVWPGWIGAWRATLAAAPHVVAPVTRMGGPLLLLALLRWKRADARLLVALSCVPHTTVLYETIPLLLIPETWIEAGALWAMALLAFGAQWLAGPYTSQADYWASGARWIVLLMYVPCLAMVLRRPNVWSVTAPGVAPPARPIPDRDAAAASHPS